MEATLKTKTALIKNTLVGKVQSIVGWFTAVIFGLGFLGLFLVEENDEVSDVGYFITFFIIALVGVFLIYCGRKKKALQKDFRRYIGLISMDITSIPQIAQHTNQSVDQVKANLVKMIDRHFFVDARIDEQRNEIVIAGRVKEAPKEVEMISVKCEACSGVSLRPVNGSGVCAYCGSPL
ncbi:hypothetical protein [Leadbettera azotonutricia]|uniref:Uncharacterized protein n=1 Tax=Leadbettera azotonutricia (strain ATCC BAA-888 / DSM 13862 / ZAS-9) TaxID=545695 RepID=F5Y8K7_LEAAZ|nr:hypothetical protein [Leadbettera azotonutricia]AEF80712.1 hypothetical protein TREAZ_3309 [Leadbettera azotonutricia ZAS-9]